MRISGFLASLLAIAFLPSNVLSIAYPQRYRGGNRRPPTYRPTPSPRPPPTTTSPVVPETSPILSDPDTIFPPVEPTSPTRGSPPLTSPCVGPTCDGQTGITQPTGTNTQTQLEPTRTNTETGSQPTGTSTPNNCGGGGGGIQVQWTGEVVSYSWPQGSGVTEGCLDLTGFTGQVAIGGNDGTILEVNPSNYFDISYILGYTVPVVCTGNGESSGCNIDLFGNGGVEGDYWKNPTGPGGARDPGGYENCPTCVPWCYACSAADPFVAPCAGSAYAYPYDDGATRGPATALTCCVGTNCPSTGREGATAGGNPQLTRAEPCGLCAGTSKRSVDQLGEVMGVREEVSRPKHKRHGHRKGGYPYSPLLGAVS
ncbi:MAG: hypothetical protein Q9164_004896 [Protoblastenia rupestris]